MGWHHIVKKKFLLISPKFNNYENRIIKALEGEGYIVDLIIEKKTGFLFQLIYKYLPKLNKILQVNYLMNQIKRKKDNSYNKILVIRGEFFDSKVSSLMSKYFNGIDIVFYQWDSVINNSIILNHLEKGYKVITFDPKDAEEFKIPYLPLFFSEEDFSKKIKYDLFFLGSYTVERFRTIMSFVDFCDDNCIKYKFTLHANFFHFLKSNCNKLFDKNFYKYLRCIKFSKVKYKKAINDMQVSNVVLDISHRSQSGLTMRVIEAVGLNLKLLTNNQSISTEEFYQKEMIMLSNFCMADKITMLEFIKNPRYSVYKKREKYSLSKWVDSILNY